MVTFSLSSIIQKAIFSSDCCNFWKEPINFYCNFDYSVFPSIAFITECCNETRRTEKNKLMPRADPWVKGRRTTAGTKGMWSIKHLPKWQLGSQPTERKKLSGTKQTNICFISNNKAKDLIALKCNSSSWLPFFWMEKIPFCQKHKWSMKILSRNINVYPNSKNADQLPSSCGTAASSYHGCASTYMKQVSSWHHALIHLIPGYCQFINQVSSVKSRPKTFLLHKAHS